MVGFAFGVLAPRVPAQASNAHASWPIVQRIEGLLSRLTLEEKVGQMNMVEPGRFRVMVGASSEDLRLNTEFQVTAQ